MADALLQTASPGRLWPLTGTLRRGLLLLPPLAFAAFEGIHPRPDVEIQAVMDVATGFASFHAIQLILMGLLALSVLLLADEFGVTGAWTTRLGVGVFLIVFSAYDAVAGIATGLAMRSARDLSPAEQNGVWETVKDWPGLTRRCSAQHRRHSRLGCRPRRRRSRRTSSRSSAHRVDLHCTRRRVLDGRASLPVRHHRLRLPLHRRTGARTALASRSDIKAGDRRPRESRIAAEPSEVSQCRPSWTTDVSSYGCRCSTGPQPPGGSVRTRPSKDSRDRHSPTSRATPMIGEG
jgi:hypothetical protein